MSQWRLVKRENLVKQDSLLTLKASIIYQTENTAYKQYVQTQSGYALKEVFNINLQYFLNCDNAVFLIFCNASTCCFLIQIRSRDFIIYEIEPSYFLHL